MTNFKCVQSSGLNCRKFVIDIDNYTITKDVPVFKNILDKPKDHEVSFKKTENSSFVTSTTAFVNPIEKKDIPKAIPSND